MDGDANRASLVSDGSSDGLANPPGGVSRELVTTLVLELLHGFHEANVALLNEVKKLQASVGVLLGNGDHQPEVGLDELSFGLLSHVFAALGLSGDLLHGVALHAKAHLDLANLSEFPTDT